MGHHGIRTNDRPLAVALDTVIGHDADGSLVRLDIPALRQQVGGAARRLVASFAELQALSGAADAEGAEVLAADQGQHAQATATGYDGASVANAGLYTWVAAWGRWVRIGEPVATVTAALSPQDDRPGDAPDRFTLSEGAIGGTGSPIPTADIIVRAALGRSVQMVGTASLFHRTRVALSQDVLEVMARVRVEEDRPDPANGRVDLVLRWYDSNAVFLSETVAASRDGLTASDGLAELSVRVSALGVGGVLAPPADAVYVVGGLRQNGPGGVLAAETLRIAEITDLHVLDANDLGPLIAQTEAARDAAAGAAALVNRETLDGWADITSWTRPAGTGGVLFRYGAASGDGRGGAWTLDVADTTSPHSPPEVLVSADGSRFKPVEHVYATPAELAASNLTGLSVNTIVRTLSPALEFRVAPALSTDWSLLTSHSTAPQMLYAMPNASGDLNLLAFGADAAAANNSAAVKRALERMFDLGCGLFVPGGPDTVYTCTDDVHVIRPGARGRLTGTGAKIRGVSCIMRIAGAITEIGTITAAAPFWSRQIEMSSVAGLAVGDVIGAVDDRDYSFSATIYDDVSQDRPYYKAGDFNIVRSITGTTVSLRHRMRAAFEGLATDRVWRVDPIDLTIKGVVFENEGGAFGLQLRFAVNSTVDAEIFGGTSAALSLDRCWRVRTYGVAVQLVATGDDDYGIAFSNSADCTADGMLIYGPRHAVTNGGAPVDMAIPCHDNVVRRCDCANGNEALQVIDGHGNTSGMIVEDNEIHGFISIGGRSPTARRNRLYCDSANPPITYNEFVGGHMMLEDNRIYRGPNAGFTALFSTGSVPNAARIKEDYQITVDGLWINEWADALDDVVWAVRLTHAAEGSVRWSVALDGIDMTRAPGPGFELLQVDLSNPAAHPVAPYRPDDVVIGQDVRINVDNNDFWVDLNGSFTGCRFTMPDLTVAGSFNINAGETKTGVFAATWPAYPVAPTVTASYWVASQGANGFADLRMNPPGVSSVALFATTRDASVPMDATRAVNYRLTISCDRLVL